MIFSVSLICIVYMVAIFGFIAGKFFVSKRKERIKLFKNFKKGKFALIYLASIPLYAVNFYNNGYNAGGSFLKAMKSTIDLIVLKFDYDSVSKLMSENTVFAIAMSLCFTLVTLNAAMFTFSLCGRALTNAVNLFIIRHFSKNIFVVIGNNQHNFEIINSASKRKTRIILMGRPDEEAKDEMFAARRAFVPLKESDDAGKKLTSLLGPLNKIKVTVIVNTKDDRLNLTVSEDLSNLAKEQNLDNLLYDSSLGLSVYVFCAPENESAFACVEHDSGGRVHRINKYNMIAADFVSKHPFTAYMDENYIDYKNAAVYEDVSVNTVIIGFGKTNQQIFLSTVSDITLMQIDKNGNYVQKPVNYFIFDKADSINHKNLNHSYFRYVREYAQLQKRKDEYLPLPPLPANYEFFKRDINSHLFYDEIKQCLSSGKKNIGYIIISCSDDMGNVDLALKISETLREWALGFPVYVFVKIRDNNLSKKISSKELYADYDLIPFGEEKTLIYDIDRICNLFSERLAKRAHLVYSVSDELASNPEVDLAVLKKKASDSWYAFTNVQRVSNTHACQGIRVKLNLCGYDIGNKNSEDLSKQFVSEYENGNPVIRSKAPFEGRKAVLYDNASLEKDSLRKRLAIQEHCRWNAYMCCAGCLPATIEEIKKYKNNVLLKSRKHGNMTNHAGLIEYRKLAAVRDKSTEEDRDVIRYDFQLMDDVKWLLGTEDLKITKKAVPPKAY